MNIEHSPTLMHVAFLRKMFGTRSPMCMTCRWTAVFLQFPAIRKAYTDCVKRIHCSRRHVISCCHPAICYVFAGEGPEELHNKYLRRYLLCWLHKPGLSGTLMLPYYLFGLVFCNCYDLFLLFSPLAIRRVVPPCCSEVWFGSCRSCLIAHDQAGARSGLGCSACHLAELWGRFSWG